MEEFHSMKKTITIDAKQYKAALKSLKSFMGPSRSWSLAPRWFREGVVKSDEIVRRLSTGWTFDGDWKAPEKETKP
jgi:hypothetical protein